MISVVNIEVSDPLRHTVYWRESHTSHYDPSQITMVQGQVRCTGILRILLPTQIWMEMGLELKLATSQARIRTKE